jgi:hypothetical protein
MTDAPFGLQALRNREGGSMLRTKLYRVTATGNTHGIFIGDPVGFNGSGLGIVRVSSNAAATAKILGGVSELFDDNGRPLTFSLPTRGPFLPASTAGWAAVHDAQGTSFIIQADASCAETVVGQYVSLTASSNAGNTASGVSKIMARVASADTSVKMLQVIGISPTEQRGLGSFAGNAGWGNSFIDLEVRVALHALTST